MTRSVLVADVGGTKTSFGIGLRSSASVGLSNIATYSSTEAPSFARLLQRYQKSCRASPSIAVLAVAGRVAQCRVSITNLPWVLDASELEQNTPFERVCFLNDVEALATSIPHLHDADVESLHLGNADSCGTIAVLAPGTGLGESFLVRHGDHACAHPTEGGHASFAPNSVLQIRLLEFLTQAFGHVSTERVCSGSGLQNLYRFFVEIEGLAADERVESALAHGEDPTPSIVERAHYGGPDACFRAVQLLAELLGAEAGNLALRVLSSGGVYFGGGMPPRIASFLRTESFRAAFQAKGRFSDWLRQVPVRMITNPHAVLLGAAFHGFALSQAEGN